jgi:acetylornithine deacetylase/succinyl-diaminopimelate desuccinylase-like protein
VDYALVPDVAEHLQMIDVAEKGVLFLEITSHGKQAHGSRPHQGINAIWNMMHLLHKVREAPLPHVAHRFLSPPTLNLGHIEGGSAPNMVPARCRAALDIRYLPGTTEKEIVALVQSAIAQAEAETGGRFELRVTSSLVPTEGPENSLLVHALAEATEEVTGSRPKLGGMSGATVVKQLLLAGIPAIGCGLGDASVCHAANERVPISELFNFSKVLVLTCLKTLAAHPPSMGPRKASKPPPGPSCPRDRRSACGWAR